MRIDVLTLFPDMFVPLEKSIINRAREKNLVAINVTDIRSYTTDKHRIVDDYPYGGGPGMVMKPEPIFAAVEDVKSSIKSTPRVILMSPSGEKFTQDKARELSKEENLILICGHYEGIDHRVREALVTDELSVGDFVLTGGELPAMVMIDAIVRLIPGVLGDELSSAEETFAGGILEYPQYTRPPEYQGFKVPEVLLQGNHEHIRKWRRARALEKTWKIRPDLLRDAPLNREDLPVLAEIREKNRGDYRLFTALVHYPVYNKKGEIVNTSVTNLDLHDIARASATYGVEKYFVVQPSEAQHQLVKTLINHWQQGFGSKYNPDRQKALSLVEVVSSLEDVKQLITEKFGSSPRVIASDARAYPQTVGYRKMREIMADHPGNYLLLFGTGWGLEETVMTSADYILQPVYGPVEYNHLSVRSAASIILDRLLGEKWW